MKYGEALLCLLLNLSLLPYGNATNGVYGTQTITPVSAPTQPWPCVCAQITYVNNYNATVTAIIYGVFHNGIGQTVYISTATIHINTTQTATALLVETGLPSGIYNTSLFAVTPQGVVISPTSTLSVRS